MNYTQYKSSSGSYGSGKNDFLVTRLPIFSDYTMMRSGQYSYILVTGDTDDGVTYTNAHVLEVTQDVYDYYKLSESDYDTVTLSITADYYVYGTKIGQLYGGYDRYTIPFFTGLMLITVIGFFIMHIIHDIRDSIRRGSK